MTNLARPLLFDANFSYLVSLPRHDEVIGSYLDVNVFGSEKICSYDCVYCYLGPTSVRMNSLKKLFQFIPVSDIIQQLELSISTDKNSSAIVFSGNGESTLYPEFSLLISEIKRRWPSKLLYLFTNGVKISEKKNQELLMRLDQIILKLDCGKEATFKQIAQPLVRTSIAQIIKDAKLFKNLIVQTCFFESVRFSSNLEDIDEWLEVVGLIQPSLVRIKSLNPKFPVDGLKAIEDTKLHFVAQTLLRKKFIKSIVLPSDSLL